MDLGIRETTSDSQGNCTPRCELYRLCMDQSPFVCCDAVALFAVHLSPLTCTVTVTVTITVGLLLSTLRCSPTRAAHAVVQAMD